VTFYIVDGLRDEEIACQDMFPCLAFLYLSRDAHLVKLVASTHLATHGRGTSMEYISSSFAKP
jgi:hypothetical protein